MAFAYEPAPRRSGQASGPDGGPLDSAREPARTPVFIVCSARAGAGKTFLARLLIGFHLAEERPVRAFDLDLHDPALAEFIPRHTAVTDISDTRGQMALFDELILEDGRVKVVDLPHTGVTAFFNVVEQIGFFEEARTRTIDPVVMYATDAHPVSAQLYATLNHRFPRTVIVPVQNEAIARIGNFRELYPTTRAAAVPLRVPVLAPPLKAVLDRHHYTFADLRDTLPVEIPIDVCFELRSWTKRAFLEFRELELRMLLEKLRGSLRSGE